MAFLTAKRKVICRIANQQERHLYRKDVFLKILKNTYMADCIARRNAEIAAKRSAVKRLFSSYNIFNFIFYERKKDDKCKW